jgi:site-specific recombinase XerD
MGAIEDHAAWCARRELSQTYLLEMAGTLRRLQHRLGPLEAVTEDQLRAWWDGLTVAAGSRVTYAAHVASFYRWLRLERLRDDDPTARLIRPRLHRRLPRPIADENLRRAMDRAAPPVSVWLALAAYMGARACEIAALRAEDIRRDLGVVMLHGKGDKQRVIPLHPEVALGLVGVPESGPVYLNAKGHQISANSVSSRANRYLHSVGVPESLHQCRHWFATAVYRESLDLRLTQELMGHASPTTTAGYAAWSPERAARIVETLSVKEEPAA